MAKGNFIDSLRLSLGSRAEPQSAAGTSQEKQSDGVEQNTNRVIPKVPSFKYTDPIDSYLRKSGLEDEMQEMIWEMYEGDQDALGDNIVDFRRRLGTDKSFRDNYINSLMDRIQRGGKPYGADSSNITITDLLKRLRQHSFSDEEIRRTV